ncbi:hypothetical protein IV203_011978 [Nitzschia inconspicua]|uniref:Uncharacterized protein n=1 Tax=Nitzschia inconspicua TaxID=303405 RepID=A0A9K3KTQ8_9STRA|nr:hypothetical protein IV203_011978 [Nitzschia inconspicua]
MRKCVKQKVKLLLVAASFILALSFTISLQILFEEHKQSGGLLGQRGSLQSLRSNRNVKQQSLNEFTKKNSNKHKGIVRYSQRYQTNQDKRKTTEKLLDEKLLQRKEQQSIQDQRNKLQEKWLAFQNPEDISNYHENGIRFGYRLMSERKRRYPKILYFLHIHKSAGSTFCRQAYLNRISANYKRNCNVQSDQRCCGHNDTLEAQREYANTTYYDLVASEQEMYDSMAPDSYDYIVSLRDSKRRYYSHWNHLVIVAQQNRQHELKQLEKSDGHRYPLSESAFKSMQEPVQGRSGDDNIQAPKEDLVHWNYTIRDYNGTIYPVGNFTKWYQAQPDNYNVRMICGVRCNHVPKYQLSRDLFRYALQRLAKFAHIIFVEDMEASFARFATVYGWQYNVATAHHGQHLNSTDLTKTLETGSINWDPYMSVLDDSLYEFAQRKYAGAGNAELMEIIDADEFANREALEEYFAQGPKRGCTNECCGPCSKW